MIEFDLLFATLVTEPAAGQSTSVLKMIQSAGLVGYVLIALSILALTMVIMHVVQIRKRVLAPPAQLDVLDSLLAQGDVVAALEYCMNPEHDSYLTRILAAGLTRYQRSAFGAFEIKNAVEEAGEEQTAKLYRSTDVLGVIGSIAPLLGLTGTVLGIVGAFETLSVGVAPDHKALAANISLALVATLLGLILAIPCMALFTYFRNRIDALAGETGAELERLLLHLESTQPARPVSEPARPTFVPRPAPIPQPVAAPKNA
ncbi:MAG: MotA/TolQ/ExbB proton channel family protein [Phycisphaerales bacterium]|nr:MotA/TolQ/ExbB proton channel family protein [Phycisphaerales bacterium]MCI0630342.1 MotA/TolQ/ExbB proton channel family protein [Phycisphaerales bacterium]MCI0677364.1 MotA/TolQ/ExbB proton channel family protein [Phycisphaerales bacterium]